jgi:EmrB/QacA subfamily drug resistance transporter
MENKPTNNRYALLVICIIIFVVAVADSVLNLALPAISGDLGATATQLLWIVDAYMLVVAALQVAFGVFGDRYGRKRMLQAGLILFGLGSLGSALSVSADMLIIFRAVTGLGAAIMMPSTLSIITDLYRDPKERTKAIATWSSTFVVGVGLGPIIGGALLAQFSWTSVFYLNLPIVLIGFVGTCLYLYESCDKNGPKPNIVSSALFTGGLAALAFAIISAGEFGWLSLNVLGSFGVTVVVLVAYLLFESRSKNPMLPLYFFKNKAFTGSIIALTLCNFVLMGFTYLLSLYFQSVQGYSALDTSLCLLPLAIFVFVFTMLSVRIEARIGTKLTVSSGLMLIGFGMLIYALTAGVSASYYAVIACFFVLSLGIGLTTSPATSAIMNSIPRNKAGVGSAINNTARQIGATIGVAILGAIVNAAYLSKINSSTVISGLSVQTSEAIRKSIQSALTAAGQLPNTLASQVVEYAKQAYISGIFLAVIASVVLLFVAAVISFVILPKRVKSQEE